MKQDLFEKQSLWWKLLKIVFWKNCVWLALIKVAVWVVNYQKEQCTYKGVYFIPSINFLIIIIMINILLVLF